MDVHRRPRRHPADGPPVPARSRRAGRTDPPPEPGADPRCRPGSLPERRRAGRPGPPLKPDRRAESRGHRNGSCRMNGTLLVTGATGSVGGNICRLAVEHGLPVRGLVRNLPAAKPLEALGVDLVEGDVTDVDSVMRAARGRGHPHPRRRPNRRHVDDRHGGRLPGCQSTGNLQRARRGRSQPRETHGPPALGGGSRPPVHHHRDFPVARHQP